MDVFLFELPFGTGVVFLDPGWLIGWVGGWVGPSIPGFLVLGLGRGWLAGWLAGWLIDCWLALILVVVESCSG